MEDMTESEESLAWIWVIEAMAGLKEVSLSLLHDLVEAAPKLPGGSMKNAKERVAFRCLEELFARQTRASREDPSVTVSKVGFDVSESCEDVLKRIVQEGNISDLAKWEIEPFIRHKRDNMPKSSLEKLSHSIRDGTHPHLDFLRRSYGVGPTNPKRARDKEISPMIVENGEKRFEGDLIGGDLLLPTKRSRNGSASEDYRDAQVDNGRRAKRSPNLVSEPNLVSVSESERREDFPDAQNDNIVKEKPGASATNPVPEPNPVSVSGSERCEDFPEQGLDDCRVSENARENDDKELHETKENLDENLDEPRGSPSFDTALKNSTEEPKGKSDEDFQFQSPNSAELEEKTEESRESETSSDNNGYRNERTDVAKRKHVFLSSQLTESLGPGIADSSEQSPCMKCREAGHALVCNGANCQVAVHEKCLGSPPIFDDTGNFYCPFCAYSLAIAEYLDAKKRSSLSRKELSAFIGKPKRSIDGLNKTIDCTKKDGNLVIELNINPGFETKEKKASNRVTFVDKEKAVEECPSRSEGPQKEVHDKLSGADTGGNSVHRRKEVSIMRREVSKKQDAEAPIQLAREFSLDSEEDSETDHDESTVSNYCIRVRKKKVHHSAFRAIPLLRRKKVPWTTEEEETIKEGVQRFSDGRTIQWKKILEFGESVFLKGRTTVDLKDKWRNICKGSPKSK